MNKTDIKMLIGQKLKVYRKRKGLTQEKLCELAGIDISGYSETENGKTSPGVDKLCAIMYVLKINPSELFDFIEYENLEQDAQLLLLNEQLRLLNTEKREKVAEFINLIK